MPVVVVENNLHQKIATDLIFGTFNCATAYTSSLQCERSHYQIHNTLKFQ